MSYYQGDFYQGDPGFLSFLGKGIGALGGMVPGIGGALSRLGGKLAKTKAGRFVAQHPTLTAAGASGASGLATGLLLPPGPAPPMRMGGGTGVLAPQMHPMRAAPGVGARGFHLDKKTHTRLVRNRRMRVTNPKALRRAIRRARGFERLARRVMHFVSPRKTKGRAIFRARRATRR